MSLQSWLNGFKNRIKTSSSRKSRQSSTSQRAALQIEKIEQRTLLTAQALVQGGLLTVVTDADETVVVQANPNNPLATQVLVDGFDQGIDLPVGMLTDLEVFTGDDDNTIDLSGVSIAVFPQLTMVHVDAGNGDDTIIGTVDIDDSLVGGDGNDTFQLSTGDNTVRAGDGDDTVLASSGDDDIDGGDGNDQIFAAGGDDTVRGDDGLDFIAGGDGNDSVMAGNGNDSIVGNAGQDTLIGDPGNDTIMGGADDDYLLGGGNDDVIDGEDGNDLILGNSGDDTINGSAGNDFINSGAKNDIVNGDAGNDTINGGLGNDTLRGDDDNDLMFGGGGNDDLNGNFGNDTIHGNSGDDTLCGGFGSDSMDGNNGDDLVQSICEPVTPIGISIGDSNTGEGGAADVVLVVDRSGSTGGSFQGTPVGDVNNDGNSDSVLDAELASLLAFHADLVARGVTAQLSVIDFGSSSTIQDMDPVTPGVQESTDSLADMNNNMIPDFVEVVQSITISGGTNFEDPLQDALQVFQNLGTAPGDGTLVFLSDGQGFGQFNDEVMMLNALGVDIRAYGVGMGASLNQLQMIDPGASIVTTSQALATALTSIGVTSSNNTVDLVLSAAPPVAFSVDFVTADGTATAGADYTAGFGTINFAAGQTTATIPIQILGDTLVESPETLTITLSNLQVLSPTITPFLLVDPVGTVTIFDRGTMVPANPPLPPPVTIPQVARGVDFDADTLLGSDGNDTLIADAGNDFLQGDLGNDSLVGGIGDDTQYGGGGNDTLQGEEGADLLAGQGGADVLDGGDGEDELIWRGLGDGDDTLFGGNGGDQVTVNADDTANSIDISQDINGLLVISESTASITIDSTVASVVVNGGQGNDLINVTDVSLVGLSSLAINGESGDDRIDASTTNLGLLKLELSGGIGNDTLIGSQGADLINGGENDDSITGNSGDDEINGGSEDDIINASDGNDTVNGDEGNDTIFGEAGDDVLNGGAAGDFLDGGQGDDTIQGSFGDDVLIGSFGNDSLDGGIGQDFIGGGKGNDFIDGGRNGDTIKGHTGDDTIRGNHGDDSIEGNGGDDEILGGDGDDTIIGADGNDGIDGGDGNDFILGDLGDDIIRGGDGDDNLVGGGGKDILLAEDGADTVNGNGGSDIAALGEGADFGAIKVERVDESFILSAEMLLKLDGI